MKALVCKAKNFTCLRCRCQSLTGIGGRSYAAGPNICLRLRRLLTVTNSVCSSPSSRRTPGSVFCTAKAFFVYPLQADAIVIASNIYLILRTIQGFGCVHRPLTITTTPGYDSSHPLQRAWSSSFYVIAREPYILFFIEYHGCL